MFHRARSILTALTLPLGSLALAGVATTTVGALPASPASCPLAPAYATGGKTFMGSNVSPGSGNGAFTRAVAAKEAKFGTLQAVRTYDSQVPRPDVWRARAVLSTRANIESFKIKPAEILAGTHDAALTRLFTDAPTAQPIFWSLWHEPESEIKAGDFTAVQYRDAFRRVVRLAAAVCHSNLYPTLILEGWTADPRSKRNWRDYYPGDEFISVIGFDPYNTVHTRPTSYPEPAVLYGQQRALAQSVGKAWGIAETGSALVAGDDGRARAAWLHSLAAWLRANDAAFAIYFDSVDKVGIGLDFVLGDAHSSLAWKTAISRYGASDLRE